MLNIIFNRGSKDIVDISRIFDICIKNSGNIIHTYVDFLKDFRAIY